MATILKKNYMLKNVSKTLIRRVRGIHQVAGALARLNREERTEGPGEEDAKNAILNITGEEAGTLFTAAGKVIRSEMEVK